MRLLPRTSLHLVLGMVVCGVTTSGLYVPVARYFSVPPQIMLAIVVFPLGAWLTQYGLEGLRRMRVTPDDFEHDLERHGHKLTAQYGLMTGPLAMTAAVLYVVQWYYRG